MSLSEQLPCGARIPAGASFHGQECQRQLLAVAVSRSRHPQECRCHI